MSCPVSDVDCDVVVAIEREATIAHNPTISERQMLKNVPTILGLPIPAWVFDLLALTRGVQVLQAHVDAN